jgi:acyl-CoA synthetase (AMP-forming)/AMP-acid ligase II/acyl carrier protein
LIEFFFPRDNSPSTLPHTYPTLIHTLPTIQKEDQPIPQKEDPTPQKEDQTPQNNSPIMSLSEAAGRPVDTSTLSHLNVWQKAVAANPNALALISYHQKAANFRWVSAQHSDSEFVEWTFADLDRGARRLATTLNSLSPINRAPIACFCYNQAEWALMLWAAAYLHAPLVPINPKSAIRSEEVSHMLKLVQPAVIVAPDSAVAADLEKSLGQDFLSTMPVKVMLAQPDATELSNVWKPLSDIMSGELTPPDTPTDADPDETSVILFTSGTTSLPKPCALSSAITANAALAYTEPRDITAGHRFILHLPNFHSYGIGWALGFLLVGATIIYPSEAFEAQASLECIEKFKATHMSLVPTTAQSMTVHPAFSKTDISSLISLDISGAGVLPSVVESCEAAFKVPAGTSYGMTESPSTLIWPIREGSVLRNGEVLSGRPSRGARVKICEPGTTTKVPRGVAGELHNGGVQVISEYMDPNVKNDSFYIDEEGGHWIITGDQAIMEEDGAVRISGRYKDIIIRGGENISPASIEALLQKAEGVYMAQVVGVPDEMAGEVPIAVIESRGDNVTPSNVLKDMTSKALGPAFAPKTVINLKTDLGLDDWPKTAAGKIRKVELAVSVREWIKATEGPAVDASAPTVESLIRIWKKISGADGLLPESSINSFADSLMMMQLSGTVKKDLGRDITVEDFKNCDKIQDQADLIDSRPSVTAAALKPQREGPPAVKDMPFVNGDEQVYAATKANVAAELSRLSLPWEDVEDVVPMPDWDAIFAHRCRPSSWNLRWSYHAPCGAGELERAMKQVLAYHPTLRSIAVERDDEVPLLVTVRANKPWFRAAVTAGHKVDDKEGLNTLLLDHQTYDTASLGGPMFRVHVASIADGTSGLVIVASHAVCDMSMTKLWLDDIVTVLSGDGTLIPHASFSEYASAYNTHRFGTEATNGVDYWTNKLQGIGSVSDSTLWPPQRTPEFFKGNDFGWRRHDGRRARATERRTSLSHKLAAQKGVRRMVKCDDIHRLKSEHDIPIFMLVKAAIALLNVKNTGGKEAIFGTLNAARNWPFQSDYSVLEREAYTSNPLDISGCTVEYVLDRIPVALQKNVVSFMQNVSKGEEQNSAFAHAPFLRIVDRMRDHLGEDDLRSFAEREDDADALLPLIRRQSFNWLPTAPTAQGHPKGLNMLQMLTRMDNGLTITGFLADDKKSVALSFTWDAEHMTTGEANIAIDCLAGLVKELCRADNWTKSVREVMGMVM